MLKMKTKLIIIFAGVILAVGGFFAQTKTASAGTCKASCDPTTETEVANYDPANTCVSGQVYCERKAIYSECDPVGNVSTDGNSCSAVSNGWCQNGVCVAKPQSPAASATNAVPGSVCNSQGGTCGSLDYCNGGQAIIGSNNDCPNDNPYCCIKSSAGASSVKGSAPTQATQPQPAAVDQIQTEPTIPNIALPNPKGGIQEVLLNILRWLLQVVGIIALISFIVSGIQYFAAAGSENRAEAAKRNMLYSIIGVVIVFASFLIVQAIQNALAAKTIF